MVYFFLLIDLLFYRISNALLQIPVNNTGNYDKQIDKQQKMKGLYFLLHGLQVSFHFLLLGFTMPKDMPGKCR